MFHKILPVGMLQCNCSILGDETSGEAIVVDPGDDVSKIAAILKDQRLTAKYILVTHAHIDHIAGAAQLKKLTGAPVFYNQNDLPLVKMMDVQAGWLGMAPPEVAPPDAPLADGQIISIKGLAGTVLHTPGHTPGSVCLYLPEHALLLAGDTLFAGSIGRTDLPGGDGRQIIASIRSKLMELPDKTRVVPGHGPNTSIGEERESNPFIAP
ncbi:MAG: MBL fold metallo-hydrolase [Acidobacteriaceae bacterium]|nr:MBL fold metallo-hydrolase [Acidobacteriaceae bacterium]